jgi:hypothetical protein
MNGEFHVTGDLTSAVSKYEGIHAEKESKPLKAG